MPAVMCMAETRQKPSAIFAAAVVVLVVLARCVLDVAGLVAHLEGVRAARAGDEPVWRAWPPARDARHRVPLADDVRIDGGGGEHLLAIEAPAVAAVLTRPAGIGLVVAPGL